MKTTIDIPDATMEQAMKFTGAKTKREAVVTAMDVAGKLGFSQLNIATVHEDAAP